MAGHQLNKLRVGCGRSAKVSVCKMAEADTCHNQWRRLGQQKSIEMSELRETVIRLPIVSQLLTVVDERSLVERLDARAVS